MLSRSGIARAPLAGVDAASSSTPGQYVPPPTDGGTRTFSYSAQVAARPLAFAGLAGGGAQAAYPGGGVVLVPQPDVGLMKVLAWWPDATGLHLIRSTPDGASTPVRGAYPITTTAPTRRNYSTNPSLEAGLNGWAAGAGSPSLTRISTLGGPVGTARRNLVTNPSFAVDLTGWSAYNAGSGLARVQPVTPSSVGGGFALQVTSTAAGNVGASHTISGVVAGLYYTASAYVWPSVARDVRVYMEWRDGAGATLATNYATTTAVPAGAWTRVQINRVAPANAVTLIVSAVAMAGAVNDTLLVDAALVEQTALDAVAGDYFDGASPGAAWDGTPGNSSSRLTVVDSVAAGAYALRATSGGTPGVPYRANLAAQPQGGAGWLSLNSNSTAAVVDPLSTPPTGTTRGMRATSSAAGDFGAYQNVTVTPGRYYTASMYLRPNVAASVRISIDWKDSGGTYISTTNGPIVSAAANAWTRVEVNGQAPPNADRLTAVGVFRGGASTNTLDVTGVLVEDAAAGAAAGSYFDGATAGYRWSGTAYVSTSVDVRSDVGLEVPHALPGLPQGGTATIGLSLRTSTRPTSVVASLAATDAGNAALTATTAALTADQINSSVNQWARQVLSVAIPVGATTIGKITLVVGGLGEPATVDVDAVTVEQATASDTYVDGDSLGAQWLGTAGLSPSVVAPVLTLLDGECPLDVPVTYQVSNPALTGGRLTSAAAVLPSADRTWLTHPARPTAPVVVDLRRTPTLVRKVAQGVFQVLDRRAPVVVSAAQRQSVEGTIEINALSWAERDVLLGLFNDASPVLVRDPGTYSLPGSLWIALGDLTEDAEGRKGWQDVRLLSAPFVEVDPPPAA